MTQEVRSHILSLTGSPLPVGGPQTPSLASLSVADPLWTPSPPSPLTHPLAPQCQTLAAFSPSPLPTSQKPWGFPKCISRSPGAEHPVFPPPSDQISAVTSFWKSLGYEQQMGLAHSHPPGPGIGLGTGKDLSRWTNEWRVIWVQSAHYPLACVANTTLGP